MNEHISTTPQRSRMMSNIRGMDTLPERQLRSGLFVRGLRYRLHARNLPGSPDLVFPRFHAAVFVHGCFWHRHEGCRYATIPKHNADFWKRKFKENVARDRCVMEMLHASGWRVAIVWECALKLSVPDTVHAVEDWLRTGDECLVVEGENARSSRRQEVPASLPGHVRIPDVHLSGRTAPPLH